MFSSLVVLLFTTILQTVSLEERIVGGRPTSILRFPYHLSLLHQNVYQCGASLITPIAAVTGAHCVLKTPPHYAVRAGSSFRNSGGLLVRVQNIIIHPQFSLSRMDYDVAVLIFAYPLPLCPKIAPIELPWLGENPFIGSSAVVTGWGLTDPGNPSSMSPVLRKVDVMIMDQNRCKMSYGSSVVTDRMMCAGFISGGRDACQGDSGGPLVQNWKLIGIVSWGIDCGQAQYPGIYTRTSQVRLFIRQFTGV